jgi:hypothetical protein
MAEIYDIDAYLSAGPSQKVPMTRNQQLLLEIQAMWDARLPEQIHMAKIKGTQEELQEVQRRYARLLESKQQLLTPGEIADDIGAKSNEDFERARGVPLPTEERDI